MLAAVKRVRPGILMLLVVGAVGCSSGYNDDYYGYSYPYAYPWGYSTYGTYGVVRRPVTVVGGWTNRAFRYRPYRGYRVHRRHHSPLTYTATKGSDTLEVTLTGMKDSTRVEVQARQGGKPDKERAKQLMGAILKDYDVKKK